MLNYSEEIDKIRKKIKELENEDVYIEIEGALQFHITIENAKILVSSEKIFITNEKNQDIIVELHYLDTVEINNDTIYLEMSNDIKITLDF